MDITITVPIGDALEVTRDWYGGIPRSLEQTRAIERVMCAIDDAIQAATGVDPAEADPPECAG